MLFLTFKVLEMSKTFAPSSVYHKVYSKAIEITRGHLDGGVNADEHPEQAVADKHLRCLCFSLKSCVFFAFKSQGMKPNIFNIATAFYYLITFYL